MGQIPHSTECIRVAFITHSNLVVLVFVGVEDHSM